MCSALEMQGLRHESQAWANEKPATRTQGAMAKLHAEGRCRWAERFAICGMLRPCIFFMKGPRECQSGNSCTHCHSCTYEEARRRRNRISYATRLHRRCLELLGAA